MDRTLNTNERRRWSPRLAACVVAVLAAGLLLSGHGFAQEQADKSKEASKPPSLYQRMGGYDVISNVVDDFLDRLHKDQAFDRFGGGRAMDSLHRTKQLVKDFICWKADGPCAYIGRDMAASHQGLQITKKEWEAASAHLQASLVQFKIGEKEQKEIMAMVETLRDDIIEKPKKEEKKEEKPAPKS